MPLELCTRGVNGVERDDEVQARWPKAQNEGLWQKIPNRGKVQKKQASVIQVHKSVKEWVNMCRKGFMIRVGNGIWADFLSGRPQVKSWKIYIRAAIKKDGSVCEYGKFVDTAGVWLGERRMWGITVYKVINFIRHVRCYCV